MDYLDEAVDGILIGVVPPEIIVRIANELPTPDLCSLRLVCSEIEQALYPAFVDEFFAKKQFMLSPLSLWTLIDMSSSRISRHMRCIQIGTDQLHLNVAQAANEASDIVCANEMYSAQFELLTSGSSRPLLHRAFRNLLNLDAVVIRDSNSRTRYRDGPEASWTSYGASTARMEPCLTVSMDSCATSLYPDGSFAAHIFNLVLSALGDARVTVQSIEVMTSGMNRLPDSAFSITASLRPAVARIVRHLEHLHLCVTYKAPRPNATEKTKALKNLPEFLKRPRRLKSLRINATSSRDALLNYLLSWMATPYRQSPISGWPCPPDLVMLRDLSLGYMMVRISIIAKLAEKLAPSLRKLVLWKIHLVSENNNACEALLHTLADIPKLQLSRFIMGDISERLYPDNAVDRPESLAVAMDGRDSCSYSGTDFRQFLRDTAETIQLYSLVDGLGECRSDKSSDPDTVHSAMAVDEVDAALDSDWMSGDLLD